MTDLHSMKTKSAIQRIAAIDVGSNSTHMLIAEKTESSGFRTIDVLKEQTRLAADIDDRLMLDSNALSKMTNVLKKMKEVALSHGAFIRCIATHPLREAKNGHEFASRLSTRVGIPVEIVSGQEEARLVSLGVRAGLPISDKSTLIIDVGGGSAEIILCQWNEVRFATSLKLGAVRLTQKFLESDPFSEDDLQSLEKYVISRLEPVCCEIGRFGFDIAVASSGTAKALKLLAAGMTGLEVPVSLHGLELSGTELELISEVLFKNRSVAERRLLPRMDSKRADIIVAGAMVLNVLCRLSDIRSFTLSTTALREGIFTDTWDREAHWLKGDSADVRWQSVREFGQRLRIDEARAFHIATLTMSLLDSAPVGPEGVHRWRELLRCAAYLHECGKFLNTSGFHKHAHYLIRNSCLLGFAQIELEIIAACVRFHRKRLPRSDEDSLDFLASSERHWIARLSSLLRLAVSLDRGRLGRVRKVRFENIQGDRCILKVTVGTGVDPRVELYELDCEKEGFERAFGRTLDLRLEETLA